MMLLTVVACSVSGATPKERPPSMPFERPPSMPVWHHPQICDAYSANRYPFPEEVSKQRQMHSEVGAGATLADMS